MKPGWPLRPGLRQLCQSRLYPIDADWQLGYMLSMKNRVPIHRPHVPVSRFFSGREIPLPTPHPPTPHPPIWIRHVRGSRFQSVVHLTAQIDPWWLVKWVQGEGRNQSKPNQTYQKETRMTTDGMGSLGYCPSSPCGFVLWRVWLTINVKIQQLKFDESTQLSNACQSSLNGPFFAISSRVQIRPPPPPPPPQLSRVRRRLGSVIEPLENIFPYPYNVLTLALTK